jgi:hypothetical protein
MPTAPGSGLIGLEIRLIQLTLPQIFYNTSLWALQRSTYRPGLAGAPPTHLSLRQPILARLPQHQDPLHQQQTRQYQLKLSALLQSLYL